MNSGKKWSRANFRAQLGGRDRRICADVLAYGLTTNEFIRLVHLPDTKANAATKISSRLVAKGWLTAYPLIDKRLYFVPGKSLVRQFGLPAGRTRPFGPQALATHVSLASFCITSSPRLNLLDESGFGRLLPWVPQRLRKLHHATLNGGDDSTLRLVRIDLGGTPEHVAKKCRLDLTRREPIPGYAQLIAARQLVVVVLTSTDIKCQAIKLAIQKLAWPASIRFQIVVVDDLLQLLGI